MGSYDAIDSILEARKKSDQGELSPTSSAFFSKFATTKGKDRERMLSKLEGGADPVDIPTRMATNTKITGEGVKGYLQNRFGTANIIDVGDGNFAVFRGEGKRPLLLENASDGSLGGWLKETGKDILDAIPEIAEGAVAAAGAAAGGLLGAETGPGAAGTAVAGGAAGAMAARGARQFVSSQLPGRDFPGGGMAAATDVASAGALDAAGGEAGRLGGAAMKALWGKAGKYIPGSVKQLGREIGVGKSELGLGVSGAERAAEQMAPAGQSVVKETLGEATLGAKALAKEAKLRQLHPEVFRMFDVKRSVDAASKVDEVIASLGPKMGAEEAAAKLAVANGKSAAALVAKRKEAGDLAFGKARELVGDSVVIDTAGTVQAIDRILERGSSGAGKLKEIRAKLSKGASIRAFQDQLAEVGAAVAGDNQLLGMRGKKGNIATGKQLFAAMMGDLDAAAAAPLVGRGPGGRFTPEAAGEAARALKAARDGYRVMSEAIDEHNSSVVTQLMRKMAPRGSDMAELAAGDMVGTQKFGQALLSPRGMGDADVAKLLKASRLVEPEATGGAVRSAVEEMLSGTKVQGYIKELGGELDFKKYAKALGDSSTRSRLAVLVGGEKTPQFQLLSEMGARAARIARAGSEMAKASGKRDIGEEVMQQILMPAAVGAAGAAATGTGRGGVTAAATAAIFSKLSKALSNPKSLAIAFTDPELSMQLLGIMKAKPGTSSQALTRMSLRLLNSLPDQDTGEEQ